MAYSGQGIDLTFTAASDLNNSQFRFVTYKAGNAGQVIQATGASNPDAIGVLMNDPVDGGAARVRVHGTAQVYVDCAASAIVYGGHITCGSTGLAVPQGSTSSSTIVLGRALGAVTSGSGVLVEILLYANGIKVGAS